MALLKVDSWQYTSSGNRDLRLDFLRGFCLMVMLVNHLGGNSWLYALTGKTEFYISAAEGFLFISGLVLGIVSARKPLASTVRQLLKRTFVIYLVTVVFTIGFAAAGFLTPLNIWYDVNPAWGRDPLYFVVSSLTLHTTFHGSNILSLYIVFLLAAPLALLACSERRGWCVLLLSWLIWWVNLFYPQAFTVPIDTVFPAAAWQPLFFTGLVLGYNRDRFNMRPWIKRCYYATILLLALMLLLNFQYNFLSSLQFDLADRAKMPLARMVATGVYLQTFYLLTTWFWRILHFGFGWLLLCYGQNGLCTFALHIVVMVLFRSIPGYYDLDIHAGTVGHILAILTLWGMIHGYTMVVPYMHKLLGNIRYAMLLMGKFNPEKQQESNAVRTEVSHP